MLLHLPLPRRPDAAGAPSRQPLEHPAGMTALSGVSLRSPEAARPSPELASLVDTGLIDLRQGPTHLAELHFDDGLRGRRADLAPELPLVLIW